MLPSTFIPLFLSVTGALSVSIPRLQSNLVVELDYATYRGTYNAGTGFNIWKGVRYAAPPMRWQAPQWPTGNSSKVIQADTDPTRCPQSPLSTGGSSIPTSNITGDEDCLFANIYAPAGKTDLPVLVYIHGGGYGTGQASTYDFTSISHLVDDGFMFVIIQYRLGAFGFASSAELAKYGVANAGLYDQYHALEWVQRYISAFNGNPNEVTLAGESAGGGSVALQAMAYGGTDGTRLWSKGIASSPYIATQWDYDGGLPTKYYNDLAQAAGCLNGESPEDGSVFQCLSNVDSNTLQTASAAVSASALYGQWAFIPVTDGTFLQSRPSLQLLNGRVNGGSMVVGQNANEGFIFVSQNITSQDDFIDFIQTKYPLLSDDNIKAILDLYAIHNNYSLASSTQADTKFDSNGLNSPYATEMAHTAEGWQQAANNLYAETTFVCPAYWLSGAYSPTVNFNAAGKYSWRYQYSPPNSFHAIDLITLQAPPIYTPGTTTDAAFRAAFQGVWGTMITTNSPTLPTNYLLKVTVSYATSDNISAAQAASWQPWGQGTGVVTGDGDGKFPLLNLNVTASSAAKFLVADGMLWEGGRGARCDLWAELGAVIQE